MLLTKKKRIIFLTILIPFSIVFAFIMITKPHFFYKQPFKIFGYVAYDTCIYDDNAFTATNNGFYVNNVSDMNNINRGSFYDFDDTTFAISVVNGDLYVGYESGYLIQYDITDIHNIIEKERIHLSGTVTSITSKDNHLYASTSSGNIYAIDLTDYTISSTYTKNNEYIRDLLVYKNLLLFASIDSGVGILDLSEIDTLNYVTTLSNTSASFDINIYENKLFVSRHSYGLTIFNISDNSSFSYSQNINNGGEAYSSDFNGEYLVIGDLQDGVETWKYNFSTSTFEYVETYIQSVPHVLFIKDDYIVIADQDLGLYILKLSE